MALAEYKKKRKFQDTPEPEGHVEKKSTPELRFVVQRHHARRLHYDFRLELDGVLKSWAVPKGPSLDPSVKRLAMMVEDHPIDYMTFEGTIPPGNYGAGEVVVWDLGVYHSSEALDSEANIRSLRGGLKKGHLSIVLYGQKLKGGFTLIKTRGRDAEENAWLLIKQQDEYATTTEVTEQAESVLKDKSKKTDPFPHEIRPMLAELTDEPFNREGWIYEIKWDGYRAIAEIEPPRIHLYSRNGLSFDQSYPTIINALSALRKTAVVDGEIIALKHGKPDFHSLQNFENARTPLQYAVFDLLYFDGEDLRKKPLIERKSMLKYILPDDDRILFSDHVEEQGIAFYNQIKAQGLEGIMAKDGASTYIEGRRSRCWFKIKIQNQQEAIIVGYTEPKGSRKRFGALVLAVYNGNQLEYVGHSGGGFTDEELETIYDMLSPIRVEKSPFKRKIQIHSPITWVQPKYVCEIKFTEWTPEGSMRHPVYVGMRPDKDPREVTRETEPVLR